MSSPLQGIGHAQQLAQAVSPRLDKLKEAARGIEAIFLKDLLSQMRKSVHHVSLGKSYGGEMFDDLLDQAVAESATKKGDFGIAKNLYQQFSREVLREEAAKQLLSHAETTSTTTIQGANKHEI